MIFHGNKHTVYFCLLEAYFYSNTYVVGPVCVQNLLTLLPATPQSGHGR